MGAVTRGGRELGIRGVWREWIGIVNEQIAKVEGVGNWFRYCDGAAIVSLERPAGDRDTYDFRGSVFPFCAVDSIGSDASRASRACAISGIDLVHQYLEVEIGY